MAKIIQNIQIKNDAIYINDGKKTEWLASIETEDFKKIHQLLTDKGFDNYDNRLTVIKKIEDYYDKQRKEAQQDELAHQKYAGVEEEVIEPITLEEYDAIIQENFPGAALYNKACLATICTLFIKDLTDPTGLILQGNAASEKTTILSWYYDYVPLIFKTDSFTPASFVSHSVNIEKEQLEEIDLLPKIRNKCFVAPELAPLFGKPKEDLTQSLAIMTRVFDGEGYESDSGSQGHRGYSGEYLFSFLGATTPIPKTVWKVMGSLGHRWLYIKMPNKDELNEDLLDEFTTMKPYKTRLKECKIGTKRLLHTLKSKHELYSVGWDPKLDREYLKDIINVAQLVRLLRAPMSVWTERDEGGGASLYEFTTPIPEMPKRLINLLYNMGKGHAILHGRTQLNQKDIDLIYKIGFSSMPFDRTLFFEQILNNKGTLTTNEVEQKMQLGRKAALKLMKTFEILGICNSIYEDTEDSSGRPGRKVSKIMLKPQFKWVCDPKITEIILEDAQITHELIEETESQQSRFITPDESEENTVDSEIIFVK